LFQQQRVGIVEVGSCSFERRADAQAAALRLAVRTMQPVYIQPSTKPAMRFVKLAGKRVGVAPGVLPGLL
jgi:hypothetical protein